MCTALSLYNLFGRNLDYEFDYGQKIIITPRNYIFNYNNLPSQSSHYAIIGMGIIENNYPLYFDGANEKGLAIAGLNFVGNAKYHDVDDNKINIAQHEFIPYILSTCQNTKEVKELLNNTNISNIPFSKQYPLAQLHWLIGDDSSCIVVESCSDGLHIYDNDTKVLTNNPPFNMQQFMLNQYMSLSNDQPDNTFSDKLDLKPYSRGFGSLGLPGDLSSTSRFVKACFTALNSLKLDDEEQQISQFFHILKSVEQQKGCCKVSDNKYEYTIYSSCIDLHYGIYYYITYNNYQINAVNMNNTDLNSNELVTYPFIDNSNINYQ